MRGEREDGHALYRLSVTDADEERHPAGGQLPGARERGLEALAGLRVCRAGLRLANASHLG